MLRRGLPGPNCTLPGAATPADRQRRARHNATVPASTQRSSANAVMSFALVDVSDATPELNVSQITIESGPNRFWDHLAGFV
mmetsp:Transcript_48848/g.113225  ORF Transcript_48848/g.113225 Transcript_48848/m.113225 type:complete len:82 (+) Transcript_48848:140-385(+)